MAGINYYPPAIQQAYDQDPRTAMAQALVSGRGQQPVQHWAQGVSNLFNQFVGQRNQKKLREEYGGQAQQYRNSEAELVKALMGDQSDPQTAALLSSLQNNPMMADKALPVAMQSYGAQQTSKLRAQERKDSLADQRRSVDTGAEIITYDGHGAELSRVPKAMAPGQEAQLRHSGTTAAETARHNKEMERLAGIRTTQAGGHLTEGEGKAVTYGQRAVEANATLSKLETGGYRAGNARDRTAAHLPVVGNAATSGQGQQYNQAKLEFISAILRRDSGATITPQEIATADATYFPQFGEGPTVIKQKAVARQRAIEALRAGSGRGAKLIQGAVNGETVSVGDMPTGQIANEDDPLGLFQ